MRLLFPRKTPWLIVTAFLVLAAGFFVLAAGPQLQQLPRVFSIRHLFPGLLLQAEIPLTGSHIRQEITANVHDLENITGRLLQQTGQELQELATEVTPPPPATVREASPETPHGFRTTPEGFQAVFPSARPARTRQVFFLRDPARWVVDVDPRWEPRTPRETSIPNAFIERVVIGRHPEFTRIVFHYANPKATPHGRPKVTVEADTLVITIPNQP